MNPAEQDHYVKVEFVLLLNAKFEGVNWVHPWIPKHSGHINFGKHYSALNVPYLIYDITNCREYESESFIVKRIPDDCVIQ